MFFGLAMAASVRISNSLGAGCPQAARRATFANLGLSLMALAALLAALLTLQVEGQVWDCKGCLPRITEFAAAACIAR